MTTIPVKGKNVKAMTTDIIKRYPYVHPNLLSIFPKINGPAAVPSVPIPSIIPVTVEVALLLPCSC